MTDKKKLHLIRFLGWVKKCALMACSVALGLLIIESVLLTYNYFLESQVFYQLFSYFRGRLLSTPSGDLILRFIFPSTYISLLIFSTLEMTDKFFFRKFKSSISNSPPKINPENKSNLVSSEMPSVRTSKG